MSVEESNEVEASMQMQNLGSPFTADGTATYNPIVQLTRSSTSRLPSFLVRSGGVPDDPPVTTTAPALISNESAKRKRGRPRKYGPDSSANPGMISPSAAQVGGGGGFSSPTPPQADEAAVPAAKRGRGRPPGSGRKQQVADSGSEAAGAGYGWKPHIIMINAGEDVLAKLMSFCQSTSKVVCILSANGSISNVSLRLDATSGGTVAYEGRFEILTLSGSFVISEAGGQRSRAGGLTVSLAGPDGQLLGGAVAGVLTAAAPVQVIVGSFSTEEQTQVKPGNSDTFDAAAAFVSGAFVASRPPSPGTLSESSGGGPVSPRDQLVETSNSSPSGVANLPWI